MLTSIYSVRDGKAEAYLQPFFSVNDATAVRSMVEVLSDPQHHFTKYAEDFHLYRVGVFDDATGELSSVPPHHVVHLVAILPASEQERFPTALRSIAG